MRALYKYFLAIFFIYCSMNFPCVGQTTMHTVSVETVTNNMVDKNAHYVIEMKYPRITAEKFSDDLNQRIETLVNNIVTGFKLNIIQSKQVPITGFPLNENANHLAIDYVLTLLTPSVASIRFSIYTFYYAAAHPLTTYMSMNYSLQDGKMLNLNDLFNPTDYLAKFSLFSQKVLAMKLTKMATKPTEPDMTGLKPTSESFKVWNLTPKGFLLTFPPYQVAAYAFGPQEVLLPYTLFQENLSAQAKKLLTTP